jgi:transposase InsO family protein
MRRLGLRGVRRDKGVRTTTPDANAPCPLDRVNRQFKARRPNQLWMSNFTYVSTWQGWQYVVFVIGVYTRRIVGWRQSSSMRTDFVLDALEQALYDRQPYALAPSEQRVRASLVKNDLISCSWLHLLKAWSLLKIRGDSIRPQV